jgi:hypothetical protein
MQPQTRQRPAFQCKTSFAENSFAKSGDGLAPRDVSFESLVPAHQQAEYGSDGRECDAKGYDQQGYLQPDKSINSCWTRRWAPVRASGFS